MRKIFRPCVFGLGSVLLTGAFVLACGDDDLDGGGPAPDLDSSVVTPPVTDAAGPAAKPDASDRSDAGNGRDASDGSDAGDASDGSVPDDLAPFVGIWRGVGVQGDQTWTILVDIHGGAAGELVGVMTYPSLACAGTLARVDEADAGTDAGPVDAGVDGGGPTVTLRETVSEGTCVPVGDDVFTVLPNGDLAFAYRILGASHVDASGTLTRVGTRQAGSERPLGIWSNGAPDTSYLWPLLATISRTDTVGAPVGVFARAIDATRACAGLWTLQAATASTLTLLEVFADENTGCPPATTVSVTLESDAGLIYLAPDDAGADARLPLVRR